MSVSIVAKCDGCGCEKTLKISETGRSRDVFEAVIAEAWTPVFDTRHLCPKCVQDAFKKNQTK